MSTVPNTRGRSWTAFLLLVGVALLGAIWAALAKAALLESSALGCGSCGGADVAGAALALLGALLYATILVAGIGRGPSSAIVGWGILAAGGVHGALMVAMLSKGPICFPCLLTGFAAIGAMGIHLVRKPDLLARATFALPAAACAANLWLILGAGGAGASGAFESVALPETPGVLITPSSSPAGPRSRLHMTIFYRDDCPYCHELDDEVLPLLRREFGDRLVVRHISARGLPGIPTPTIVLAGPDGVRHRTIPGLPRPEVLRSEILDVYELIRRTGCRPGHARVEPANFHQTKKETF